MPAVAARQLLPGASVEEVQRLWLDLGRWPSFVDGFGALARSESGWPHPGARIVWDSLRSGRGRVVEEVIEYVPAGTQLVRVEDPALTGEQRVRFQAVEGGCEISLELAYEIKRGRGLGARLTDLFFVRRALADALRRTLRRFAVELQAEREMADQIARPRPLPRNEKES